MTQTLDHAAMKPLFILGCVRSGTTLVRDLLRRVPHMICPEETHYFRYGEPFRTNAFNRPFLKSATLLKHREIDGISPEDFERMLGTARTRGELLCLHVEHMARQKGWDSYQWFDKTPQNVYGLPMIRAEFPKARFLHLVRNPLNVVASLKLGKVMKVPDIDAACNYWLEAVQIVRQMAPVLGPDLLEVNYEDFAADPVSGMAQLLTFSGFGDHPDLFSSADAHVERNQYLSVLSRKEQTRVVERCAESAAAYGYHMHDMIS